MVSRKLLRLPVTVVVALLLLTAVPPTQVSADGEVLAPGSNVCSDITKVGNTARATCNNVGDCPVGITGCWLEIKWQSQCEWAWCTTYDDRSSWIRVAVGSDTYSYCVNGKQRYQLRARIAWVAPTTKTVETWGQNEYRWEIGGGFAYRLLAKFLFNVTNNAGYRVGTRMAIETGVSQDAGETTMATSGGQFITLSC